MYSQTKKPYYCQPSWISFGNTVFISWSRLAMETDSFLPTPTSSRIQLATDLQICRTLNGMWQVSGAHGHINPEKAVESMFSYLDSGFTTWDLADHYGPAEDYIGEFRRRLADRRGSDATAGIQAFTKWVPNPGPMDRNWVEENIN